MNVRYEWNGTGWIAFSDVKVKPGTSIPEYDTFGKGCYWGYGLSKAEALRDLKFQMQLTPAVVSP